MDIAAPNARSHTWRSRVPTILSILLAAVLLVLALRGVSWSGVANTARHGRPAYLVVALLGVSVSYAVRAVRWRVLVSAEKAVHPLTMFWATAVGYLGNSFLPARAGEILRSIMLSRATALSVGFVLATALTERLLDAVALVLISVVALAFLHGLPLWLHTASRVTAVAAVIGLGVLVAAPRFETFLAGLFAQLPLPGAIGQRGSAALRQFLLGTRAFQHPARGLSFAGLTCVVWLIDTVDVIIIAAAFHLSLSVPQGLLLLAALGLASAVPSTPGYVGIFQFVAVTVLAPFGFSRGQALVFIVAFQATVYVVVLVWGLLGLWRLNAKRRSVTSPIEAIGPIGP